MTDSYPTIVAELVDVVQTADDLLHLTWVCEGERRIQTDQLPPGHSGAQFFQPRIGKKFGMSRRAWDEMRNDDDEQP
jgi:hypothetical protein